jgi:1,4-dihydroxy-2-naphthoate octaprenyltransferase
MFLFGRRRRRQQLLGHVKTVSPLQFSRRTALWITAVLFLLSTALGVYLVSLTDIVVLLAGGLCFFFGVIYSWGPAPLSHGPYGEIVSGFFYGAVIPFILVHINAPGWLFSYVLPPGKISVEISMAPAAGLLLLAVLPFCLTAVIMLANNILRRRARACSQGGTRWAYYLKKTPRLLCLCDFCIIRRTRPLSYGRGRLFCRR